jgi:D-alanyl-D-alanine-carboxypeptidase/D-alanyl-D-alanine-endopeptidase
LTLIEGSIGRDAVIVRVSNRWIFLVIAALLNASYAIDAFGQQQSATSTQTPLRPVAPADLPSDAAVRQMLVNRIDVEHRSVGIVVGLLTPQGRRIVTYGHLEKGDSHPLDGDTIFEIGSMSKVFTSLLLAQMVQRGEMALNDPVAKYLPDTVKVPEKDGKKITLADLATHTSGLERMPTNFTPQDPDNPFVDYSAQQLYSFLSGYTLTRDPGAQYEYSNLAAGLLGFVVSRRAGMSYEELVRKRICDPLQMNSTTITLTPEMKRRLAVGHQVVNLESVANWDFGAPLAPAGAIRSSTNDLLKFLAANLGYTKTPLAAAMKAMLSVRRPTGAPNMEVALGWHTFTADDKEIIWHNGATGGYRTFFGFDPKSRVGVIALSNTRSPEGVDDIGRHLLDEKIPLWEPPKEPETVEVDPKTYDRYVGTYQLAETSSIAVTRKGDHLYAQKKGYASAIQTIGYGPVEVFPESAKKYFVKGANVRLTFSADGQGRAGELLIREDNTEVHAKRVD